eukprot:4063357-Pleurochrysis_carterae.AAC.1
MSVVAARHFAHSMARGNDTLCTVEFGFLRSSAKLAKYRALTTMHENKRSHALRRTYAHTRQCSHRHEHTHMWRHARTHSRSHFTARRHITTNRAGRRRDAHATAGETRMQPPPLCVSLRLFFFVCLYF